MKVIWLGQAGLLFETDNVRIMTDPYLSESVEKVNPANYRRVAVNEAFFQAEPDILVFTHNHLDHYDPETAGRFLTGNRQITVLAPSSVWKAVKEFGGDNNYVQFDRHTSWTEKGMRFTAVKAEHSDRDAIGVILEDLKSGKKYYVTGDTLYNDTIFPDIPNDIYALFLPINGVGNNMNLSDAARFAQRVRAQRVIPIHIGMFDELRAEDFVCDNRVIPEIYKEIHLD